MVTTKIGKGDIFGQNLPVQQDQNAFGKCSEYSEIQAGRFLQNEIKKPSPAFSSSPIPSQNTLLGCPVPCSTIRETCHSFLWQGFCVETFIFLCFVLSIVITNSSLPQSGCLPFSQPPPQHPFLLSEFCAGVTYFRCT